MKRILVLAGLLISSMGSAQDLGVPTNTALRVGFGYAFDESTRDVTGNLAAAGLDYFLDRPWMARGDTFLSFDWLGGSITGGRGNIYPIMVNQRFSSAATLYSDEKAPYFQLGVGIVIVDVSKSDMLLGFRGGLGTYLTENLFVEGNAVLTQSSQGNSGNLVGVYLGYRF